MQDLINDIDAERIKLILKKNNEKITMSKTELLEKIIKLLRIIEKEYF